VYSKTACITAHNSDIGCTCLGYLWKRDSNIINPFGSALPKVAKSGAAAIALTGIFVHGFRVHFAHVNAALKIEQNHTPAEQFSGWLLCFLLYLESI
jgi:hypothetical protein